MPLGGENYVSPLEKSCVLALCQFYVSGWRYQKWFALGHVNTPKSHHSIVCLDYKREFAGNTLHSMQLEINA